jgi:hypothetical protein
LTGILAFDLVGAVPKNEAHDALPITFALLREFIAQKSTNQQP